MLAYKPMCNPFYRQLVLENEILLFFYVNHGLASSDHDIQIMF